MVHCGKVLLVCSLWGLWGEDQKRKLEAEEGVRKINSDSKTSKTPIQKKTHEMKQAKRTERRSSRIR